MSRWTTLLAFLSSTLFAGAAAYGADPANPAEKEEQRAVFKLSEGLAPSYPPTSWQGNF